MNVINVTYGSQIINVIYNNATLVIVTNFIQQLN